MAWISFLIMITTPLFAAELPRLLTKHSPESLRFITMDGRYAYVEKKLGVLGLVSSFRSSDFLSDSSYSNFLVSGTRYKSRLIIEVIPSQHNEYNLFKNNKLFIVNWGNTQVKEIGTGKAPRLHLMDEWISYYDGYERNIHIQNIPTQKKYTIKLGLKPNPFFIPQVQMVTGDTVLFTDVDGNGYASLVAHNLTAQKNTVVYKATQNGTRIEVCENEGYLAFGEFPYEGVTRGSQIYHLKITPGTNLAGYSTIYDSSDQDLGNMICLANSIYFIKTTGQDKTLMTRTSEAARLDLKTMKVEIKTSMNNISQLLEMDERVLIPMRGEFYVLEGQSNIGTDVLKSTPGNKEEIQFEM